MKSKIIEIQADERTPIYNKSFGVYFNGDNNLYPNMVENLIDASPTASQCRWLYKSFLGGAGFSQKLDVNLGGSLVYEYYPNDLLDDVAESIAYHGGVFIHINYNAEYKATTFKVLDYTQCRIGKRDDADYSGKIVVSKLGWGRKLSKKKLDIINVFNPRKEVIQEQVENAGGWEFYKGQILFYSLEPNKVYPTSLIESAYLFADTEHRIGLHYNSTSRRGFNDATIIRHKAFEDDNAERGFYRDIKALMGTENSSSVLTVEDDWDSDNQEGNLRIDSIPNDIKADKYAHFEASSANYIRKAFRNMPPQLIDFVAGKLGSSNGEDLKIAQSIYNTMTAPDRRKIERLFKVLFSCYKSNINSSNDWSINLYKLLDDGTISE